MVSGGATDAAAGPDTGLDDAGPEASATCSPVLASDYDQTCSANTDCVPVGQVPSCPGDACDGCLQLTINKGDLARYTAAFSNARRSFPPGQGCACPNAIAPCCRSGMCQANCESATDAGPADAHSTSDGATSSRVPVVHRAAGAACPQARGAGTLPSTCDYDAGTYACTRDTECTSGTNGRCAHPALTPAVCVTACSYDACASDTDCPAHVPCDCRSSATDSAANVCVTGSQCRVDADCGQGGYCSPSAGYGSFNCGVAYFCHSAADTCVNDADCSGAKCQYDSTALHWRCGGTMCSPPP